MADKLISQLDSTTSVNTGAMFPLSQTEGGSLKTVKGTVEQIGDYIAKAQDHSTLNTVSKKIIGAINEILASGIEGTSSGAIASFNDGGDNIPVQSFIAEIDESQIGIDTVEIVRSGKNLFDKTTITRDKNMVWGTGEISSSSETGSWVSDFILVKPNATYIASNSLSQLFAYDSSKTAVYVWKSSGWSPVGTTGNTLGGSFTIPSGITYIRFSRRNTSDIDSDVASFQMEKNSTATTYEPYKGTIYTIGLGETLTQGGSLNVTTGILRRTDTTTKQLTPTAVTTIAGENNICANSGDVSFVYFTDKANEIAELVKTEIASINTDYHIYSTEEKVVGRWIDGKPIYEKTINCGLLPNNSRNNFASLTNVDLLIYMNGFAYSTGNSRPLPFSAGGTNDIRLDYVNGDVGIVTFSDWSSYTGYVIVRYTKTTD